VRSYCNVVGAFTNMRPYHRKHTRIHEAENRVCIYEDLRTCVDVIKTRECAVDPAIFVDGSAESQEDSECDRWDGKPLVLDVEKQQCIARAGNFKKEYRASIAYF
jgi:hypothetical protein